MIKAVIFDCFGVLATDGWLPFRDKYFASKPELIEEARTNNARVDRGMMAYEDFVGWLADNADISQDDVRRHIEGSAPNEVLFDYIRDELKPSYKIGMLSNAGANWLGDMFEPWQVALFDEVVLSHEIGAVKPSGVMYETAATRLGVLPEEAVFIDDILRFVEGAKEYGMKAVHYKEPGQAIRELREILNARTA